MAIESVATATGSGSFAINRPAGVEDGDVLIAIVAGRQQSANWNPPSGWTSESPRASASGLTSEVFTRTAGASEPSSYFFTWTGTGGTPTVGTILRVSGAALPLDDFDGGFVGSASEVATLQLTTSASCLLLHCWAAGGVGSLTIDPAVDEEVQVAQSTQVCLLVGSEIQSDAGATTPRTAEAASSTSWHRYTVAVELTNTAPNAPILTSPVDGQVVDLTGQIDLQGTFSDPDSGDELSAVRVWYETQAGTGTVDTGMLPASGQTFSVPITGNTLTAGGWRWKAQVWDSQGAASEESEWADFQAASPPPDPVLTSPAAEETIATNPSITTWTAPNQDAYQLQTAADDDGTPGAAIHDPGVIESSAREHETPRETNDVDEWTRLRIRYGGLWSSWVARLNPVSYTPPATPTAVVAVHETGGALEVSATHPAPTGEQPTVTAHDIHRQQSRDGGDTWTDFAGDVDGWDRVASGVDPEATFVDVLLEGWPPGRPPRVIYRYRVIAIADNTTTATSAWEDGTS